MKKNKKYLLMLILVFLINASLLLGYKFYLHKDKIKNSQQRKNTSFSLLRHIPLKEKPIHIVWIDSSHLWIDTEHATLDYDTTKNQVQKILDINQFHITGLLKNKKVYLIWKNKMISTPTENATTIEIFNIETKKKIKELKLRQTVRPIEVYGDQITLVDNYPNSPQRKWQYNLKTDTILIYKDDKSKVTTNEDSTSTQIHYENNLYILPPGQVFVDIKVNPQDKTLAFIDNNGTVWLAKPVKSKL